MTNQERVASSAGKKLAKAIIALEDYDGSPDDVLDDARLWISIILGGIKGSRRPPHLDVLKAIQEHYSGDTHSKTVDKVFAAITK
jgi:hypothetical protein